MPQLKQIQLESRTKPKPNEAKSKAKPVRPRSRLLLLLLLLLRFLLRVCSGFKLAQINVKVRVVAVVVLSGPVFS